MMRRVVPSVRAGAQECDESAWHIPVSIHGMVVDAVVDTAAEITIISQRVYKSLKPRPGGCKEMNVRLAGDGASMAAGFFSEVEIGICEYQCHHPVYVAAFEDYTLLGIDFLQANPRWDENLVTGRRCWMNFVLTLRVRLLVKL